MRKTKQSTVINKRKFTENIKIDGKIGFLVIIGLYSYN